MAKKFSLLVLISISVCVVAAYFLTKYFSSASLSQLDLTIHNTFKFTKPASWRIEKSPDSNDVLISYSQQIENTNQTVCLIDIFYVKADKDYSFQAWLETGMGNNIFLNSSQQTTVLGLPARQGTYIFENVKLGLSQNERVIVKKGNAFADFTLSFKADLAKTNSPTLNQCRQALSSIINSSNLTKIN